MLCLSRSDTSGSVSLSCIVMFEAHHMVYKDLVCPAHQSAFLVDFIFRFVSSSAWATLRAKSRQMNLCHAFTSILYPPGRM